LAKVNEKKTKNNHIKFDADEKQVVEVQKKKKQQSQNGQAKVENKKQNRDKNKTPGSIAAPHKLIVKLGGGKWFEKSEDASAKDTETIENESSKVVVTLRQEEISQIQKNANNLLDTDVQAYKSCKNSL
jgi:hypothetical protein